jgi:uncharacterized membrane protein YqjE
MDAQKVLKFLKLDNIFDHLSGYIEDRVAILKLELQEEAASFGAKILLLGIMFMLGLAGLLFLSIAMAIFLNIILNHSFGGFLIVGGFYLVLTVIAYSLKDNESIKNSLYKTIGQSKEKEN